MKQNTLPNDTGSVLPGRSLFPFAHAISTSLPAAGKHTLYSTARPGTTKKAPTGGERTVSDEEIKFALFGGDSDITDAMYDEVKRFAQMVKLREEVEREKK